MVSGGWSARVVGGGVNGGQQWGGGGGVVRPIGSAGVVSGGGQRGCGRGWCAGVLMEASRGLSGGGGGGRSWEIILLPLMLTLFKSRYNNKL